MAVNAHIGLCLELVDQAKLTPLLEQATAFYDGPILNDCNTVYHRSREPADAYRACFAALQPHEDLYFLDECECSTEGMGLDEGFNVLSLDVLLGYYVGEDGFRRLVSELDGFFPDPDETIELFEKGPVIRKICDFVVSCLTNEESAPDDARDRLAAFESSLLHAIQEQGEMLRTLLPFFWVGFVEPGRELMDADQLRDHLGICWDAGTLLVELTFGMDDESKQLYFRPTVFNAVNSQGGKGNRFMACRSNEWPSGPTVWHGTTANLAKVGSAQPLDAFREVVRKPLPLDSAHLKQIRLVGVTSKGQPDDDRATDDFSGDICKRYGIDSAAIVVGDVIAGCKRGGEA
jgi:hypothetical protein